MTSSLFRLFFLAAFLLALQARAAERPPSAEPFFQMDVSWPLDLPLVLRFLPDWAVALLGIDPDRMETEEAVGFLLLNSGRFAESAALFEKLLPQTQRIYGPNHPNMARLLYNLSEARRGSGNLVEARELVGQAAVAAAASLDAAHPLRAMIENLQRELATARD